MGLEFESEINDIEGGQTQTILDRRYLQMGSLTGEHKQFLPVLRKLGEAPDGNESAANAFERIVDAIDELCTRHQYPVDHRMMCNNHRIAVVIGTNPENCPICNPP